ncbi:MAG: DUF11 domain-containing protein [Saprospiraceae bacterium]|nr:DUF11 domain-containing protein [Saprospiraceae bacterium]
MKLPTGHLKIELKKLFMMNAIPSHVFKPVSSKGIRARVLISILFILGISSLLAQSVDIALEQPISLSQCGSAETVCISLENLSATDSIKDLRARFILPQGMIVGNLISKTAQPVNYIGSSDTIKLADLFLTPADKVASFSVDLSLTCDITSQSASYSLEIFYEPTSLGDSVDSESSSSIQLQSADLSIPNSIPAIIYGYDGLIDTIVTSIANGGNGALDSFYYCVSNNNPNAVLTAILFNGTPLLPSTQSLVGFDCFRAPSIGVNQQLIFEEIWMIVDCMSPSQPILRRAQYGCQGDFDCQAKPQTVFPSTSIIYDVAIPILTTRNVSVTRPACYSEVSGQSVMEIINTGTAPAQNIVTTISVGSGYIDLAGYAVQYVNGADPEMIVERVNFSTSCGISLLQSVTDTIKNVFLLPNDTLRITYFTIGDCVCNNCDIRGIYESTYSVVSYTTPCELTINAISSSANGAYNAFIDGYVEGPFDLNAGATGTMEYPIASWDLDWFTDPGYPNAFMETTITIDCGVDYLTGTASLVDKNGLIFPLCLEDYNDQEMIGNGMDTLILRWCASDLPSGFIIGPNAKLQFDVIADCDEKPLPMNCSNPRFIVNVTQVTELVIDPTCMASCTRQKIWQADDFEIYTYCPNAGCSCDGIVFNQFTLERQTYGLGDNNDDQVPDGPLNLNNLQLDRFLPGDTIKATYSGVISDPMNMSLQFGFAELFFNHNQFTPIAADVRIVDFSGPTTYDCANPQVLLNSLNNSIRVNFSSASLNGFGCGLPAVFDFDDGDSIRVCLYFQIKNQISEPTELQFYNTKFYVSDLDYGLGTEYQCNNRRGVLTQIGVFDNTSRSFGSFGACDLPNWNIRENRYFGYQQVDEFPNEIRSLGIPRQVIMNKPPEYAYRLGSFGVRLSQTILPAHNVVNFPSGVIDPGFFIESGDQLIFLAEAYFNSLGDAEIPPDEGYQFTFYPKLQGTCMSMAGNFQLDYQLSSSVDPSVFCTPLITRDPQPVNFSYTGGAVLQVIAEEVDIRLCSESDSVVVRVNNISPSNAPNAFLHISSPTGGVVVTQIIDLSDNSVITPNAFGIAAIADIPANSTRRYKLKMTANTCNLEKLNIVAGWDCENVPTVVEQAVCSDPSQIQIRAADSGMNLDVIQPASDVFVALCDTSIWEVEVRSTDLGFLRNIGLEAVLPSGLVPVPGSFELSNPGISLGGIYAPIMDPSNTGSGFYFDISVLDPILDTVGLVGSKDLTSNTLSIKFKAVTTCAYFSGSRAHFIVTGKNSCGDPLKPKKKPSPALSVTNEVPDFDVDINIDDLFLNPCNKDTATTQISIQLASGMASSLDSIKMVLPPGIFYVDNSYMPVSFASANPPVQMIQGTSQMLIWPMDATVQPGQRIDFTIQITATDASQECLDYDLLVQAYSRTNGSCKGTNCSIAIVAGEGTQVITITKPELEFDAFKGMMTLDPAAGTGDLMLDIKLINSGAYLKNGNEIKVDIYEDNDLSGDRSFGDQYLFSLSETLSSDLNAGGCVYLTGSQTFPAGLVCTIIAVLNPDSTCVCSEVPSSQLRPKVKIPFQKKISICSDDATNIGTDPVANYDFEWYGLGGAPLSLLSTTMATPTQFQGPNYTGMDLTYRYVLRSSTKNCYSLDTVIITLHPVSYDSLVVQACINYTYNLPAPPPGASNFMWSPSTNLSFPNGTMDYAVVDQVMTDQIYRLTYTDPSGCPGELIVDLRARDCGSAVVALGDTAWFDFNADGMQGQGEPGIEGVQVNLYDGTTGSWLGSTSTDANGFYEFTNLPTGNYQVGFGPPNGFISTLQDVGNDTLDSDINGMGRTGSYYLSAGEYNPTLDAGFIPDCNLDLDVIVSGCMPSDSGLVRRFDVVYEWSGNPYTYDQFFVSDTLEISIISESFRVIIDTVEGIDTLTFYRLAGTSFNVSATASFILASACSDAINLGDFDPCLFDLALKKSITTPGPYKYGSIINYDIVVFNQGVQPVQNILVTDYLPAGLRFLPALNTGWGFDAKGYLKRNIAGPIPAMGTDTVKLTVEVQPSPISDAWTNYSEITSFQDTNGIDFSDFDDDSTPDDDPENDFGGRPESPADDYVDGDGTGGLGDGDATGDEDDHDPALLPIFDVALIKQIDSTGTMAITQTNFNQLAYHDTIKFRLSLSNQGSLPVRSYTVIDYIPNGFAPIIDPILNMGWDFSNPILPTFSRTLSQPLLMNESDTVCIYLTLKPLSATSINANSWVNRSEISQALDTFGVDQSINDADFILNNLQADNVGGLPDSDADDAKLGNGTATMIGGNRFTDQDSEDPALIEVFDLALIKQVDMTTSPPPYKYGDQIKYLITIINQGNVTANNITIADSIPSGLLFVPGPDNGIWTGSTTKPVTTIMSPLAPGQDTVICIYLAVQPSSTADYVNIASITGSQDDDGNDREDMDSPLNDDFGDDAGGKPDSPADDALDGDGTGSQGDGDPDTDHDAADPALIEVLDFALIKQLDVAFNPGPFVYGDTAKYNIIVLNQGNVIADSITITDYSGPGLFFDATLAGNVSEGWKAGQINVSSKSLLFGELDTVCLFLLVQPDTAAGAYLNYAEIINIYDTTGMVRVDDADSQPGSDSPEERSVLPGGSGDDNISSTGINDVGSEDDHDPEIIQVLDVSLGSTVFLDPDNNGFQDPLESGIAGVTVQLFDSLDNEIPVGPDGILGTPDDAPGGMTTDLNGDYFFDNLAPGTYYVQIPAVNFGAGSPLEVFKLSSDTTYQFAGELDPDTDIDGDDQGLQPGGSGTVVKSGFVTLVAGAEPDNTKEIAQGGSQDDLEDLDGNMTVDFGFFAPHSIGNQIWVDANNNGQFDSGEAVLSNVVVVLHFVDTVLDQCVVIDTILTDMNGKYLFSNLVAGDYIVEIPAINFAPGGPLDGYASSSGSGAEGLSEGLYEDPRSQIDPDDPTDLGIDGDDNGTLNGNPNFPGSVVSDTLSLNGNEPLMMQESGDTDPSTQDSLSNLTVDFGFVPMHSIGNQLWVDTNNNGFRDAGEDPLPGVKIVLHYVDPIMGCIAVDTVVTDAMGLYLFDSLIEGAYIVEIPASNFASNGPLEGFGSSSGSGANDLSRGPYEGAPDADDDVDGDDNGTYGGNSNFPGAIVSDTIDLNGMEPEGESPGNDLSGALDSLSNLTVDFGFVPMHSIGNQIWVDANNNGHLDPGEAPIPGVSVILHYIDPLLGCVAVDTVMTDGLGLYLFDSLIAGDYLIEIPGSNFDPGGALEGYASSSGRGAQDLSHGPYEGAPDPDTDLDNDDNGTADGNPNFPGSVVSDTVSLNGNEPEGEIPNNDLSGALDSLSNLTIDFGFVPMHSVGNQLWVDANNNGLLDPGEDPLPGVDLILHYVDISGSVAVDTVTTDMNGLYLFDSLIAGDYFIEIPAYNLLAGGAAEGFTSSTGATAGMGPYEMAPDPDDNLDGDDNGTLNGDPFFPGSIVSHIITLDDMEPLSETPANDLSGALDSLSNLTVDFGLFAPVSIGDTSWIDINEDGIQDPGELPLEGVVVTLYIWDAMSMMPILATTDAYGNPIVPVVTDAHGFYTFDSLPPGNYLVRFDVTSAITGDGNAANWQITYQNQGGLDGVDSDADEFTGFSDTTGCLPSGTHDPSLDAGFFAPRYDLALTKGLAPGQPALVNPDDTVTMWILVANQGNVPSKKYTVNDVLPSGMEFVDAVPAEAFAMDSVVQWCDSLPDLVGVNNYAVDTFVIRAWINPVGQGLRDFQFRNWAEISQDNAATYGVGDEDSAPNDDSGYDDNDGPGTPPDDPFVDVMLDDVLLDSIPDDEDDSDFVDLFTRRFDLALTKKLAPTEPDNVVLPGDTVAFVIKVYNQGNTDGAVGIPADNITIVDYIPVNLELVEENGWMEINDSLASKLLEVGDELLAGGLQPDSCVEVIVRFVMNDLIFAETFNFAEIANATDTGGIEIIDFDSDLDSINQDTNVDDVIDDNAFEDLDNDDDGIVDEDDNDFAKIISCLDVNCYASISLSLGPDCVLEITPDMLLRDHRLAVARPDFYRITLEVGNGLLIPDNVLTSRYIGATIKATISWVGPSGCTGGTCWTEIRVDGQKIPFIEGTLNKTVYCVDPFLNLDPLSREYPRPMAYQSCSNTPLDVIFVGEWAKTMDCEPGVQDTVKIIYREWQAFSSDGVRASAFDTIIVIRPPAISTTNTFCTSKDTLYCGVGRIGPYMVLPDVCPDDGETDCDTIYFVDKNGEAADFAASCGLLVHVDRQSFGSDGCVEQVRYRVEIKQSCYGAGQPMNGGCTVSNSEIVIQGNIGQPLYGVCEFWVIDIDTLPPVAECKLDGYGPGSILWANDAVVSGGNIHCYETGGAPVIVVSTSMHDCEAYTLLPPICVYENWTGIQQVKAIVEGIGTYILQATGDTCLVEGKTGYCYTSQTAVKLPKAEGPVEIIYEVYDSCYNKGTVRCFILVKDQIKPVAVADKGVTVSISSKKVWVDADVFDEGSRDNCGINQLLARRTDWEEACINLCDSLIPCYVSEHGDTLWQAVLKTDKHLDSIEAHYAKQMSWWKEDGLACGDLIWNAWQYDLMKYATLQCASNFLDAEGFKHLFTEAFSTNAVFANKFIPISRHRFGCDGDLTIDDLTDEDMESMIDAMEQIGGGWSDQVPFDCSDACSQVTVELLVMDYWCNWNKSWTDVWVEDKTPVEIAREVSPTVEISCKTYKETGIDALVSLAQTGDQAALSQLDDIFGGYEKAWRDPYGSYVDAAGNLLPDTLEFSDVASCTCTTSVVQIKVLDEHLGYQWVDSVITDCYFTGKEIKINQGVVAVNCASNVYCEQSVWSEFDECGRE